MSPGLEEARPGVSGWPLDHFDGHLMGPKGQFSWPDGREGWLSGVSGMSRQCLRPRSSGMVACPLPWQQACVSAHRDGDTIGKEVRTMEGILLCAAAVAVLVGLGALVEAAWARRAGSKRTSVYPSTPG